MKNCQQFGILDRLLSIGKSIIPHCGIFSIKQYIQNKPIRFGYKFSFLCGADADRYLYNFELYKSKDEQRKEPLGISMVKRMSGIIENKEYKKQVILGQ